MSSCKDPSGYKRTLLVTSSVLPAKRGCLLRYSIFLVLFTSAVSSQAQANCIIRQANSVCSSGQYWNSSNSCCMQCTNCNSKNQAEETPCNRTHNAVCVPLCDAPKRWSSRDRACVISDCSRCPTKQCREGLDACLCGPCYTGDTCSILKDECVGPQPSNPSDRSDPGEETTINPLTVGLIAIGVVIGIVAFSSCFLLFGLCTTKKRRVTDNQGSENSESGLVAPRGFTNSTRSSYMSGMSSSTTMYMNRHSVLEILRHPNTPVHSLSCSSSVRSSPKGFRSSPKLVRTSPLAPEKFKEKGLVTSVWWRYVCVLICVCTLSKVFESFCKSSLCPCVSWCSWCVCVLVQVYVCLYCVYNACGYFYVESFIMDFISLSSATTTTPLVFLTLQSCCVSVFHFVCSSSHILWHDDELGLQIWFSVVPPNSFYCLMETQQASQLCCVYL